MPPHALDVEGKPLHMLFGYTLYRLRAGRNVWGFASSKDNLVMVSESDDKNSFLLIQGWITISAVDLLDVRVTQVCKVYDVTQFLSWPRSFGWMGKAAMVPNPNSATMLESFEFLMIIVGLLYHWRYGDDTRTLLPELYPTSRYLRDIIVHEEKALALRSDGALTSIDSSLKMTEVTPPETMPYPDMIVADGREAFLVEQRYVGMGSFDYDVYKFKEVIRGYERVRDLGDESSCLYGIDSKRHALFVKAREFNGVEKNTIYKGFLRHQIEKGPW